MKLFVYATLRNRRTVQKALGHIPKEHNAVLPDFDEVMIHKYNDVWPTVVPTSKSNIPGTLIDTTEEDLKKLDKWEENYTRVMVKTSAGMAFIYVFKWNGERNAS